MPPSSRAAPLQLDAPGLRARQLARENRDGDRVLQVRRHRPPGLPRPVRLAGRVPDPPAPAPPPRPPPASPSGRASLTRSVPGMAAMISSAVPEASARPSSSTSTLTRTLRLVEIARGEHDGRPVGGGPGDQPPQVGAADRIDAGGRLVQHQQVGLVQHRGDDAELLPHPAGQLPRQPVAGAGQAGPLQEFGAALPGDGRRAAGRRWRGRPGSRPPTGPGRSPSQRTGTRSAAAGAAGPGRWLTASAPARQRSSVVLPAPSPPTTALTRPGTARKVT